VDDTHAQVARAALRALVGSWRGSGMVTIGFETPREYDEEIEFAVRSPASLDYRQRATDARSGEMLHSENGIWRVTDDGLFEVSVALPGAAEVTEGATVDGRHIALSATSIARAATGAGLVHSERRYELADGELAYEIAIATTSFRLSAHLRGRLRRTQLDARDR